MEQHHHGERMEDVTSGWPQSLATVTVRWDDGTELVVNRVKINPDDIRLEVDQKEIMVDPERIPAYMLLPAEEGVLWLDAKMIPGRDDVFYTFKQGEQK